MTFSNRFVHQDLIQFIPGPPLLLAPASESQAAWRDSSEEGDPLDPIYRPRPRLPGRPQRSTPPPPFELPPLPVNSSTVHRGTATITHGKRRSLDEPSIESQDPRQRLGQLQETPPSIEPIVVGADSSKQGHQEKRLDSEPFCLTPLRCSPELLAHAQVDLSPSAQHSRLRTIDWKGNNQRAVSDNCLTGDSKNQSALQTIVTGPNFGYEKNLPANDDSTLARYTRPDIRHHTGAEVDRLTSPRRSPTTEPSEPLHVARRKAASTSNPVAPPESVKYELFEYSTSDCTPEQSVYPSKPVEDKSFANSSSRFRSRSSINSALSQIKDKQTEDKVFLALHRKFSFNLYKVKRTSQASSDWVSGQTASSSHGPLCEIPRAFDSSLSLRTLLSDSSSSGLESRVPPDSSTSIGRKSVDSHLGMAPGEKSGWRSRFGGSKKTGGKEPGYEGTSNGLTERFNLDKKVSADNLDQVRVPHTGPIGQSGLDPDDEREMAAQHIARQQRAANDARLAGLIPFVDAAPRTVPGTSFTSPQGRLDEYRRATRPAPSASSNGRSKVERMMGESGPELARPASIRDNSSRSASPTEGRSRNTSDAGFDEASCPVCLELLSFRLAGEKAHVVPLCGHALHHACFTAVYGAPEAVLASQMSPAKSGPPGMCGVCRRLIVLGEEGDTRNVNKITGLMGHAKGDEGSAKDEGGSDPVMAAADDPLDYAIRGRARTDYEAPNHDGPHSKPYSVFSDDRHTHYSRSMILPVVRVRPEFETIYRKERQGTEEQAQDRKNVVCVVSVEVPSRRQTSQFGDVDTLWKQKIGQASSDYKGKAPERYGDDDIEADDEDERSPYNHRTTHSQLQPPVNLQTSRKQPQQQQQQTIERTQSSNGGSDDEGFSYGATPAAKDTSPFGGVIDDLRHRIVDWKGHTIERFGPLVLYDFLGVRQDAVVREFHVYLFKEALLCINEEKKKEKGFARLISGDRSQGSDEAGSGGSGGGAVHVRSSKAPLKLKGRIWLRHIRRTQDTDVEGNPCLSIKLDDESLDHFVLCFKNTATREIWRDNLTQLMKEIQDRKKAQGRSDNNGLESTAATPNSSRQQAPMSPSPGDSSHSSYGPRKTSNGFPTPSTNETSPMSGQSPFSYRVDARGADQPRVAEFPPRSVSISTVQSGLPSHQQWSASGGLDPKGPVPEMLPQTAIDLVIIISVPSIAAHPGISTATLSSSAALKTRLIRSTLDFVIANMGPRDRVAIVTYEAGSDGMVRRTALLNSNKSQSRDKVEQFIDSIGMSWEVAGEDPFREDIGRRGGTSDRIDTVTAVNVGLDIVLQRKSKNPVTGMLLINDTSDAPKRGQMDLIMARAEAANVPVHCFGFGKSHDPSSLWLISNHTRGSYTFVKEWYQLRECVAGCIGALMSVALTDVRLHISVPSDNHFRVRKVTGCAGSILSSNGKDVDLDLGEMRFGECKELFVELELDFGSLLMQNSLARRRQTALQSHYEKGSATDDFMQRLGLQGLSIAADTDDRHNGGGGRYSPDDDVGSPPRFLDEVAVLEVQCGCRDPGIGVGASRLPDPCVLTIEIDSASRDPSADGNGAAGLATALADPVVTRRRLEILVSDMITRCLLLVSRRNHAQALTILLETRKIVDTVLQAIPLTERGGGSNMDLGRRGSMRSSSHLHSASVPAQSSLYAYQSRSSHARKQRERLHCQTVISLMAILEDLDVLIDGLETSKASSFERSERNYGAQQAMILRDQKAWTSRSDTEWQFFRRFDNGPAFAALAAYYAANYSR